MTTQRLSIGLSVFNLGLLLFLLFTYHRSRPIDGVAPVLRGRALEIVDDQGKLRASISVLPATTFKPTGKSMDTQVCHVWDIKDGKVTRFQQYVDTAKLHAVMGSK